MAGLAFGRVYVMPGVDLNLLNMPPWAYLLSVLVLAGVALIALVPRETNFEFGNCPRCGKALTLRESKWGQFWGCMGFPDCTYRRKKVSRSIF
jgi:predicted RNA-binding Zn-ribbon protein involved in translation (DUF1610 family)